MKKLLIVLAVVTSAFAPNFAHAAVWIKTRCNYHAYYNSFTWTAFYPYPVQCPTTDTFNGNLSYLTRMVKIYG